MSLKRFLAGTRFYQLITYSTEVDDDIAHRRLHKLKLKMAERHDLPDVRIIGSRRFWRVPVGCVYAMALSAVLNLAALRPAFSVLWILSGAIWLVLLIFVMLMIEKGRHRGLQLFLFSAFFHAALSLATLITGLIMWPFSGVFWLCWSAGALLVWAALRMMNSEEMFRLGRWCLANKMRRTHTQALQRPSEKRALKRAKYRNEPDR
ncbi:hypothetical protein SM092_003537 [Cronobacter sakazakii]|uniref:hypothetical protein n=1 Tax=Cronobacter sakazakii TaxID=28141 RepID=UPI000CFB9E6E|nr:hypothetical protein [Cronobacter sakazakii]ELQ6039505.1 hypothetical protein [Cronobacter sakazakii]ELY2510949.1 hypothetical protein [Cronobacter sakazakii]ELY2629548.1 hypothetical protein [Cronobacter sakazakii]ELY2638950.1 hypothetical protein [Cronobacter sakazakii]ELY2657941.1 hypothetical protein [Cronobacter sakazakii]